MLLISCDKSRGSGNYDCKVTIIQATKSHHHSTQIVVGNVQHSTYKHHGNDPSATYRPSFPNCNFGYVPSILGESEIAMQPVSNWGTPKRREVDVLVMG